MVESVEERKERVKVETAERHENERMIQELHAFFMKPPHEGQPSRAAQIDVLLVGVNTGRLLFKAVLFVAGMLIAVSTGWEHIKIFIGR